MSGILVTGEGEGPKAKDTAWAGGLVGLLRLLLRAEQRGDTERHGSGRGRRARTQMVLKSMQTTMRF